MINRLINFTLILLLLIEFSTFILVKPVKAPVIGVLTQPSTISGYPSTSYSYFAGSYVRHLQAAGAQIVPIQWDLPKSQLKTLFSQINGMLWPGGATALSYQSGPSIFSKTGQYLISLLIQANNAGDYFPLWSTCLGYEMMSLIFANNFTMNVPIKTGEDVSKNLYVTSSGLTSKTFKNMDPKLLSAIATEKLAFFHHVRTPDPSAWTMNKYLAGNFTVTSYTNDTANKTYPASVEGIIYPVYGSQYHPEKNTYEWYTAEAIPHNHDAILFQQYFASFFVNETRKNNHVMPDSVLRNISIDNMNPVHKYNNEFEEIYFFQNYNSTSEEEEEEYQGHLVEEGEEEGEF